MWYALTHCSLCALELRSAVTSIRNSRFTWIHEKDMFFYLSVKNWIDGRPQRIVIFTLDGWNVMFSLYFFYWYLYYTHLPFWLWSKPACIISPTNTNIMNFHAFPLMEIRISQQGQFVQEESLLFFMFPICCLLVIRSLHWTQLQSNP